MTSDSYTSSFSIDSADEDDSQLFYTSGAPEEKKRRRRGCGHPYRMRLNMSDDNNRQANSETRTSARKDSQGNYRDRQPRHLFLRGRNKGNSSQHRTDRRQPGFEKPQKHFSPDNEPRLNGNTIHEQPPAHQMSNYEYGSHERKEPSNKPRNLFPYQRNRRTRMNHSGYESSRQNQWQPNDQMVHAKVNNKHEEEICKTTTSEGTQDHFLRNLGNKVIENTKVFYKKRRNIFSSRPQTLDDRQ